MVKKILHRLRVVAKVEVHIATQNIFMAISLKGAVVDLIDAFYMIRHGINTGIVEFMSPENRTHRPKKAVVASCNLTITEACTALLHAGVNWKDSSHGVKGVSCINDTFSKVHKSTAFGINLAIICYPFP